VELKALLVVQEAAVAPLPMVSLAQRVKVMQVAPLMVATGVAVGAVLVELAVQVHPILVRVAPALPRQSLAQASLMLAAVAVAVLTEAQTEQAALAEAALVVFTTERMQLLEL
jgi:hypothetical protein